MYRQLFIECNIFKPIHIHICNFTKSQELNEFEQMLIEKFKLPYTFYHYHIPLIFPISCIKKIISEKFNISESFLMYSPEFNIEIEFTNSSNIYNPIKQNNKNIISCNDYSLFTKIDNNNINLNNIIINFIRSTELNNKEIMQYSIDISDKYYMNEYNQVISLFLENEDFIYEISNDEILNIHKVFTFNDIFNINNTLLKSDYKISGSFRNKNSIVLYTNKISKSDILTYSKDDLFISIKKKKMYTNKINGIYIIAGILGISNDYISKKKTKIFIKNANIKKNNPLLEIFLENDLIIQNIKKTYNKEIKIFFNKNNYMFITNGYKNNLLIYIARILYSFNKNNNIVKRKDKIDSFFISRTCQNLELKKRIPLIIPNDPSYIKKNVNHYLNDKEEDIFYNNELFYKCDSDSNYFYLGFLKKFDDKCIPCCYLKPQYHSMMFKKCMALKSIDNNIQTYNLNILSNKRLISNNKQLKLLPYYLNDIFNKENKINLDPETNLLLQTDKWIFLTYCNEDEITDNDIILTNDSIIFDIDEYDYSNVIYKQNDTYFEKLICISKKSIDSDLLISEKIDKNIIKNLINNKLNNNIIFKHKEIKITNRGIYYKDNLINPITTFTVYQNAIDLEFFYEQNKQKLKEIFNNVIIEEFESWLLYKIMNINILNNISNNYELEKYTFLI